MRSVWHLAINNLACRWGRSTLLVLAVALSVALTVGSGSALGTLARSLRHSFGQIGGLTDFQVQHRFNVRFPRRLLATVRSWPQVATAGGRLETAATFKCLSSRRFATALTVGVEPNIDKRLNPQTYLAGDPIADDGQIVIDQRLRDLLQAGVGDQLKLIEKSGGPPRIFRVVGVVQRPHLVVLQRPVALITLNDATAIAGRDDQLDQIDAQLHESAVAEDVEARYGDQLPSEVTLRTPASVSSGINRYLDTVRLMIRSLYGLVYCSTGLLIVIGLTTAVMQRQRELAILRCLGTARWQLALAQMLTGLLLSAAGAITGLPIGMALAYGLYKRYLEGLDVPFETSIQAMATAISGALIVGMMGAGYPALRVATMQPLQALAARAKQTVGVQITACTVCGLAATAAQPIAWATGFDANTVARFYTFAGLPLLFAGFFLLSAPVLVLLVHCTGPLLSWLLAVPRRLLQQSVLATPLRHGFTGAAMMVGLALLVTMWTSARGILNDYFLKLNMPDAFAHSYFTMTPQQEKALRRVGVVTAACSTTMFAVEVKQARLGMARYAPRKTNFVSFEPVPFFAMTDLEWVQGDPAHALTRLKQGRALLVAKEFLVAQGVGAGDELTLQTIRGPVDFEVVGVITSPGLGLAVNYFNIRRNYINEAMGSIFGTREDAQRYFGVNASNLVLLSLRDDVDDERALAAIRRDVPGVITGSSRMIRHAIRQSMHDWLTVTSVVAIGCLVLACIAVGNVIIAGIAGQRFEYGVLRAIGAPRSMLAKLVLGQTLLIALTGCVTGTGLGHELAWLNQMMRSRLLGMEYHLGPQWDVLAWGWSVVVALGLIAALPPVCRLMVIKPRALLGGGHPV